MRQRATDALVALRQIQRKVELESRQLARDANLTPSQLRVLQILDERGSTSASEIAREIRLSNATITALVDKLTARGLVARQRTDEDRRKVLLELTHEGRRALADVPGDLQDLFETRFMALAEWEQAMLVAALERVASLLDAAELDAAPILTAGDIGQKAKED